METLRKIVYRSLIVGILLTGLISLLGCQSQTPTPTPVVQKPAAPAATAPAPAPQAPTAQAAAPAAQPTKPAAAPAPATQAPAAAPAETLKLGIMASLTGPSTRTGLTLDILVRGGIDEVNAKGGVKVGGKVYKLEAITADDKSTADGAREAANRLVLQDKVRFILGSISTPAAGAQPLTEKSKVMLLTYTALDRSLGPNFPLTFQLGMPHVMSRLNAIYDWLLQDHPQVKRIATVFPDDATGRSTADNTEAKIKEKGFTLTGKEFYPLDTKDFSPLVARIMRQNPDALDMGPAGGRGPLFLNLIKGVREQGFKGLAYALSADDVALKQGAAAGDLEGFTVASLMNYKSPAVSSRERELLDQFLKKHGEETFQVNTISSYNITLILAQAMEKAGTVDDTEKIAKTLREGEFETIWTKEWGKSRLVGAKTFGLPVIPEQPIYLSNVKDRAAVTSKALKSVLP